ncbi:MAG: nickel pincer cofactor biosynthesis protein LarC [Leptospirales bacterium]|nr:nickel pincer cofactor biosynthesis protein LarC [Leptospirales bacterium]
MKKIYFDCFAGISGDMIIGAFLDAGFSFSFLEEELSKLNISGYNISHEKCTKNNISASKFSVNVTKDQGHRSLNEIIEIINKSELNDKVKYNAISIFKIIGNVEAKIHNTDIQSVHFHEIGALDSIIDICGAAICFHELGIEQVVSSALNTGSGTINTAHGILPVPAPATAEILKGIPIYSDNTNAELTTPTGAAIIKHYCKNFSNLTNFKIESIGYGAGTKDLSIPNILRIFIGDCTEVYMTDDEVIEIETSVDDMNPEYFSYLFDLLTEDGALDISVIPAVMKKNRPGHIIKILTHKEKSDRIAEILFRETTTSGIRIRSVKRKTLERFFITVKTKYGDIRVKVHKMDKIPATISPEYEDCKRAAQEHKVPLKNVYNEAIIEAQGLL